MLAYPTDTVFGLGCALDQKKSIDRLARMKAMRDHTPLAFLCPNLSDIARYAVVDNQAYRILKRATPGPFTFILPATRDVPKRLMPKRKEVGIRVPDHPVPQALLAELGLPIVTTSAKKGERLCLHADDVAELFPQVDLILDAGDGGRDPSTVVDLTGAEPQVIREGQGDLSLIL